MTISLTLPFPPSMNRLWRNVEGRTLLSAEGRSYRRAVASAVDQQGVQGLGGDPARVVIAAWLPDARRRDLDNLLKASLDGIVAAGLLLDDSLIHDLRIYRAGIDRENPRLIIWLEAA